MQLFKLIIGILFSLKEIEMNDENINHSSSNDKLYELGGRILVTGVSIMAATTLVIACWAGLT